MAERIPGEFTVDQNLVVKGDVTVDGSLLTNGVTSVRFGMPWLYIGLYVRVGRVCIGVWCACMHGWGLGGCGCVAVAVAVWL